MDEGLSWIKGPTTVPGEDVWDGDATLELDDGGWFDPLRPDLRSSSVRPGL